MALQSSDLFVVQSQADAELYKLTLTDLEAHLGGGSGIQFRGQVDLTQPPTGQIHLPQVNGDMYIVASDAATINAGWSMKGGVTSAAEDDRIVWIDADGEYELISGGAGTGGIVVDIIGTTPIEVDDSDPTVPVISIKDASTTDKGVVERLALDTDVDSSNNTPSNTAVVTADLLNATNKVVDALALSPGGVQTIDTADAYLNSALEISPTTGNAKIEIKTSSEADFGVVQIADAADLAAGNGGAGAVVTAEHLKDVSDLIPSDFGVLTIQEGGTDIVAGALDITDVSGDVTIGIKEDTFVPANFAGLPSII